MEDTPEFQRLSETLKMLAINRLLPIGYDGPPSTHIIAAEFLRSRQSSDTVERLWAGHSAEMVDRG